VLERGLQQFGWKKGVSSSRDMHSKLKDICGYPSQVEARKHGDTIVNLKELEQKWELKGVGLRFVVLVLGSQWNNKRNFLEEYLNLVCSLIIFIKTD